MLHNILKISVLKFACAFSYADTQPLEQDVQVCIFHLVFLKRELQLSKEGKQIYVHFISQVYNQKYLKSNVNAQDDDCVIQYLWS